LIDPSQLNWPKEPNIITDETKNLYQAELEVVKNQPSVIADREKAARSSYDALNQAVFTAYLDVAKGHIDRTTARAEFIEKAAGTIATLYTGILAFTYNADVSKGKVFPAIGISPTIFLGLSIFFAMFYLAYIKQPQRRQESSPSGLLPQHLKNQRNDFIDWIISSILQRAPWLQTAVISLGFGVIFLPIVYLSTTISENVLWFIVATCLALTFLHLLIASFVQSRKQG
jgi:hypothetical protein